MDDVDGPSTPLSGMARAACRRRVVGIDLRVQRRCGKGKARTATGSRSSATLLGLIATKELELDEVALLGAEQAEPRGCASLSTTPTFTWRT